MPGWESLYALCGRDFSSFGLTMAADERVPRLWFPQSGGPSKVQNLLPLLQAHWSRPECGRASQSSEPRSRPCSETDGERDRRLGGVSGRSGLCRVGLLVHRGVQVSLAARSRAGAADETRRDTVGAGSDTRPDEGALTGIRRSSLGAQVADSTGGSLPRPRQVVDPFEPHRVLCPVPARLGR